MSNLAVVGATLPPSLDALLHNRRRAYVVTRGIPQPTDELRAAIVGPDAPASDAQAVVERCLADGAPALVFGGPAVSFLGGVSSDAATFSLRRARLTEEGADDDVTSATMPGAPALVSDTVTQAPDGVDTLLEDGDGGVLMARHQNVHATLWRFDADLTTEAADETDADPAFVVAHAAALVGRWLDVAVGRTDDEKPWGRRGPQPVPAPGLSLHPA